MCGWLAACAAETTVLIGNADMIKTRHLLLLSGLGLLTACATTPTGPSVLALPGTGKTFDQFRADEFECQQYASTRLRGMTPGEAARDSGLKSAAVGTAVGATAGAAMGGGNGALVGAGIGLLAGSVAGTGSGSASSDNVQQRYDYGYTQCMYAKGHRVPVSGAFTSAPALAAPAPAPAPAPTANIPPPPR